MAAVVFALNGVLQHRLDGRLVPLLAAQHFEDSRAGEQLEGDHCRYGVARQSQQRHPADLPKGQGFARLHVHPPEVDLPLGGQHLLDHIKIPHRYPTGSEEEIHALLQSLSDLGRELLPAVAGDAQRKRHAAITQHLRRVGGAVGIVDLSRREGLINGDHLFACGQDGHAGPANGPCLRTAQGGQHADLLRAQQRTSREDKLSTAHILPRPADIASPPHLLQDLDRVIVTPCPLEADDRVGPRGDGRTGHDAHRGAGLDGLREGVACGEVSDDAQPHRMVLASPDGILRADRVAIHGGVIQGRDIHASEYILGQHPSQRLQEGAPLRLQWSHQGQHSLLRLLDTEHGVTFSHLTFHSPFAIRMVLQLLSSEHLQGMGQDGNQHLHPFAHRFGVAGQVDDQCPAPDASDAAGDDSQRRFPVALHAQHLGQPGHLPLDHLERGLGGYITRRGASPSGGNNQFHALLACTLRGIGQSGEQLAYLFPLIGDDGIVDDLSPHLSEHLL